jgi:hypothetical protein
LLHNDWNPCDGHIASTSSRGGDRREGKRERETERDRDRERQRQRETERDRERMIKQ